ncbi:hypothetical protein [Nostoc punctiforme]|uniref:Uncharacterized protein n=1 Tax=Nostoc punctiforme (strain ATCC 29133 / PCC 73102) TaxID=63737 RepID=B2IUW2_NOSP7|nr:hypothetical protein [Nostoc punctiforme]ACC84355.1 hypothetical protein Npun_F6066 [Nostoc punctiforme PCC 73102]
MKTSDWITIAGWVVSFILGLIASLIIQNRAKKKQIIAWSVVGESNIITNESFGGFTVPIKIFVNGIEENNLSTVRVRVGNKGNTEITNIRLIFKFGSKANLFSGELVQNLGAYADCLHINNQGNSATLDIDYINHSYFFDIDFLVGKYEIRDIHVDMAKAGVELIKTEFTRWDLEFTQSIIDILNSKVSTIDTTYILKDIVNELSKIRQIMDK